MENTFTNFMEHAGNVAYSDNGAVMFRTTYKPLLDCNFAVSNWRNSSEQDILDMFTQAYNNDPVTAITWLFFLRDCRGGLGERRSFRICMKWLAFHHSKELVKVLPYIPMYGRWDDVIDIAFAVVSTELFDDICTYMIHKQLITDTIAYANNEPISLLAKWMPSINTSNKETVERAKILAKKLGVSHKEYRKILSKLRKYLKVIECDMSANRWDSIDYAAVPAKAAMNYADAFMRHDEQRRLSYIQDVMLGKAKANIGGLNPYEVWNKAISEHGTVTEQLYNSVWDKLVEEGFPDTDAFDSCIPVIDTSGSMGCMVNNSVSVRDIAFSLGAYFSQKANGPFKNKAITFSAHPDWMDISNCKTPYEIYHEFIHGNWGMNTDIVKTFDLILSAAVSGHVKAEDMPKSLLIVSDMQFDGCVSGCFNEESTRCLFDRIAAKWHTHGYELPKLIFWSLDSCHRSSITVPMIDCGDNGVALISGYSQNAAKVGATEEKNPKDALLEVLNSERYSVIRKALS